MTERIQQEKKTTLDILVEHLKSSSDLMFAEIQVPRIVGTDSMNSEVCICSGRTSIQQVYVDVWPKKALFKLEDLNNSLISCKPSNIETSMFKKYSRGHGGYGNIREDGTYVEDGSYVYHFDECLGAVELGNMSFDEIIGKVKRNQQVLSDDKYLDLGNFAPNRGGVTKEFDIIRNIYLRHYPCRAIFEASQTDLWPEASTTLWDIPRVDDWETHYNVLLNSYEELKEEKFSKLKPLYNECCHWVEKFLRVNPFKKIKEDDAKERASRLNL